MLLQSWAPSTSARSDDRAASLLFFDSRPQAHGLFEFLMHETLGSSEAVDVPMLLASAPFIGATLHQHVTHVRSVACLMIFSGRGVLCLDTWQSCPSCGLPTQSALTTEGYRRYSNVQWGAIHVCGYGML